METNYRIFVWKYFKQILKSDNRSKSIPANAVYAGFPAEDIAVWRRSVVRLRQMGKK